MHDGYISLIKCENQWWFGVYSVKIALYLYSAHHSSNVIALFFLTSIEFAVQNTPTPLGDRNKRSMWYVAHTHSFRIPPTPLGDRNLRRNSLGVIYTFRIPPTPLGDRNWKSICMCCSCVQNTPYTVRWSKQNNIFHSMQWKEFRIPPTPLGDWLKK